MAQLAIFIDGAYVDHLMMEEFGGRLDYAKFAAGVRGIVAGRCGEAVDVLRTYYYNCLPHQSDPPTVEEQDRYAKARRFADALERLPRFQFRQGRLAPRGTRADG